MDLRKIAIITVSSTALFAMPLASGSLFGSASIIGSDVAHAKNGNSGNNGGGNGNAGGNNGGGKSNAGGNRGNKGGASATRGGSGSKSGKGSQSASNKGGLFDKLFKKRSKNTTQNTPESAKKTAKTTKTKTVKPIKTVSVDVDKVPVPTARPVAREKNFNAKLAGLNSLNRNYHAYMNSNDPRMQTMREFIEANIAKEDAQGAAAAASEKLAIANADLGELTDALVAYDDNYSYDGRTPDELSTRLEELKSVEEQDLTPEQVDLLASEIADLNEILDSEEAAAVEAAQVELEKTETAASDLDAASGDDALTEALLAAANSNRVAEYGEDNYVDQEMLDWANNLLGTGDAVGIIDEIREASEADDATVVDETAANDEIAETEVIVQ